MAYATEQDVEDRLGRDLDDSEAQIVNARLDDVEEIIKSRIPDLDAKILDGSVSERLVIMVEADAILRLVRNPDGYSQETDGNYSYSLSRDVASGKLEILPAEWRLLGVRRGMFWINVALPTPARYGCGQCCNPNYPFEVCACARAAYLEEQNESP